MRPGPKRSVPLLLAALLLTGGAAAPTKGVISSIDLSGPFDTRSAWRFIATQGPETADPIVDGTAPGAISLCITEDKGRSCRPDLQRALRLPEGDDLFSEPHFLNLARIVHPAAGRALLLVQIASLLSADGDQRVATQALAYDRTRDAFLPVYAYRTGRNNNQEVRYIASGLLKGAIISAEPTDRAPYGYWISVNRLAPGAAYRQVLKYRSATRYADGNSLAVIDSEMPAIAQRLGLWRPGQPLPLPAGPCPRPHLSGGALWCD